MFLQDGERMEWGGQNFVRRKQRQKREREKKRLPPHLTTLEGLKFCKVGGFKV